jgi:hypothetical protein
VDTGCWDIRYGTGKRDAIRGQARSVTAARYIASKPRPDNVDDWEWRYRDEGGVYGKGKRRQKGHSFCFIALDSF